MIGVDSIFVGRLPAWPFQVGCVFLVLVAAVILLRLIRQRRQLSFSHQQLQKESTRCERAESQFRVHEHEYSALLGSVPLGVAVLDENFIYRRCNALMGTIFGFKKDSLKGQHVFETFEGSNQDVDFYPGNWCRTTRRASQAVLDMTRSDGTRLVANLYVSPLFEGKDKGEIIGYLQVVEDITVRLESQEQLAQANRTAAALGRQFRSLLLGCNKPALLQGAIVATMAIGEGGSDFVEFVRYDERHLDLLVGTAGAQKGSPLLAACVKSTWTRSICNTLLTTRAAGWPTPSELLSEIQDVLYRRPLAGSVVRLSHLRLDLEARRLVRSDMGHNGTLLYRAAEGVFSQLESPNGPLPSEESVEQIGHDLQTGDVLLLVSPALMTLENPLHEPLGVMRMGEFLETLADLPPRDLLAQLRDSLEDFAGGPLPFGAMMTAVRFTGDSEHCPRLTRECVVHADVSNLPKLRAEVQSVCAQDPAISSDVVTHLELAVNELMTHIIFEACDGGKIELRLDRYDDGIVAEMIYTGQLLTPDKAVPEMTGEDARQFGLLIVRNCVDEIEYRYAPDGRAAVRILKRI